MTLAQYRAWAERMPPAQRAAMLAQIDGVRAGGGAASLRKQRTPGAMTGTERRYAERLDAQKSGGLILGWDFECDRIKLADAVGGAAVSHAKWKLNDFTVYHASGRMSFDEVKGSWADKAARERFRWLCQKYPFRWLRWWEWDGEWKLAYESGIKSL